MHNASAGLQRQRLLDQVRAALTSAGAATSLEAADSIWADRHLAAAAAQTGEYDAIVAAGGDSTIRGVASGLIGTGTPLGIIPIGTGNVLAEELGLRRSAEVIAESLLYGDAVQVRPGIANSEPFICMASAGFDVEILKRLDLNSKRRMGKFAYVRPTLSQLWSRPRRFEVKVDGRSHVCTWAVVMKGSHYAGSFVLAPQQKLTDPAHSAVLIDGSGPVALAGVMIAIGSGLVARHPLVKVLACRNVIIPAGQGIAFQLDGEPIDVGSLEIATSREPLAVITPHLSQGR